MLRNKGKKERKSVNRISIQTVHILTKLDFRSRKRELRVSEVQVIGSQLELKQGNPTDRFGKLFVRKAFNPL